MTEINIGDIVAQLKLETSGFGAQMQGATQRIQELRDKLDQLRPAVAASTLPFTALTTATETFSRASLAAGNSQAALRQAITQAEQAVKQFGVTTNASGQMIDKFGDQLSKSASQALQQFTAGIREAQAQLNQLQRFGIDSGTGGGSSGILQTMLGVAGGIGIATTISGLTSSLVEFAKSVVDVGQKMQGLQLAFKGIGGSAQSGAADLAFITRESQRLGLDLASSAIVFRNFEAAMKGTSLEGQQGREIFSSFALAARSMGIQGADLNRVFFALDRMIQTNVINMRELRQLSMAMPGAMEAFAKSMGVTTQELARMTASGTVLATETLPGVARTLRDDLGVNATEVGKLASTAFANLGNEIFLLKERIAASGLLDFLRDAAAGMAKLLETSRKEREVNERLGGPKPPAVPEVSSGGIPPDIKARASEITAAQDALREMIQRQQGILSFTVSDAAIAKQRALVDQLLADQKAALTERERRLTADVGAAGGSFVGKDVSGNPLINAEDKIRAILAEGQKGLAQLDLDAQFLPELNSAEEKFKSWEETLKKVRDELSKLSEPLRKSLVDAGMGKPSPYDDLITRIAGEKNIDPALAKALVAQESGFNPRATSRVGAMGLLQLMPSTAATYVPAGQSPYDPETNLRAGLSYLAELFRQFRGDTEKALTAYNAGPGGKGIPQRIGENATFAQDVLARMPSGVGGAVAQAGMQSVALKAAVEAGKPDTERLAQIRATGREYLRGLDEQERQEDALATERRHQAMETGRVLDQAYEEEATKQRQAHDELTRLAASYGMLKEARDADRAAQLADTLAASAWNEEAAAQLAAIQASTAALAKVPRLRREADSSALAFAQDQQSKQTLQQVQDRLEQLQVQRSDAFPFGETLEDVKLRQKENAKLLTPADRTSADQVRAQVHAQQQLNYELKLFEEFGASVGNAWTSALLGISDGTKTVSQAFREMARSILQSIIQITSQEAWKSLIHIGVGLLASALTPSVGPSGFPADTTGSGANLATTFRAQGGAIVNRPTQILAGENPHMNPELILNKPQIQGLFAAAMRATPTAGGQSAGGVTIINYTSGNRQQAEQEAMNQRAAGKQAILNEVLADLSRGESSRISRVLRTTQR